MVLSGSPATFMDAVNNAVDIEESLMDPEAPVHQTTTHASQPAQAWDIEESLMDPEAPVHQTTTHASQPAQAVSQSYQSPQGSQQSGRQQFRPRGKQFKKKGHSSSSGSVSSGSDSGSGSGSS
ncbi:hypothetical protein F511_17049 [Dorcoceras hygrometricum]|uniref:Uncharacterized protein n=1 Tax=Dorcoceras hygrometricum TaxID=472368 RepID=A0A2Z7CXW0_9LAMI|nr:hypothetical protein F511_17049 [Dorcoceras hygrometricum]